VSEAVRIVPILLTGFASSGFFESPTFEN
jgi:hypothetical protein